MVEKKSRGPGGGKLYTHPLCISGTTAPRDLKFGRDNILYNCNSQKNSKIFFGAEGAKWALTFEKLGIFDFFDKFHALSSP